MKMFAVAGLVLACVANPVLAQPALPVCKRPVTLAEAIRAMRTDDRRIFNAGCLKIVEAFNATYKLQPDERPRTCEDLAQIMEKRWTVDEAPSGVDATFTRIMPDGSIDLYGFSRPVRPGEKWAYDNQIGLWTMSLYCCNFPSNDALPIVRQEPVHIVAPEPRPPIREQAMNPKAVERESAGPAHGAHLERPAPSPEAKKWHDWINPTKKKGLAVDALIGAGVCAVAGCFSQETIVINRFR